MKYPRSITFCIPKTTLRFEATQQPSKLWDTKIYYEGSKRNSTKLLSSLTTSQLINSVKILVSPHVFKKPLNSKKRLSNFINNHINVQTNSKS